ncbi:MAG: esterase [Rhodoferax sp.]|nr:esterase [Rhodoferax sp.]
MHTDPVPEGFTAADLPEGFLEHVGPLYTRADAGGAGTFVLAFRAGPQHVNRYGVVHGGMLATLADTAIGANLARTGNGVDTTLTVSLSLDYLAGGRVGDWIEAHVLLTKPRGRVRFGQCEVRCGASLLVRASAVFSAREVQSVR